ncbi:hypothetical protein PTKIN_Ptkin15bG0025800 [Pterospermum kingtungense]
MMDESYWTNVDYVRSKLKSYVSSYAISKTLTEKAVIEFAAEHGLDLVTVIPTMVVDPLSIQRWSKDDYSLLINVAMVYIDDLSRALIFLLVSWPRVQKSNECGQSQNRAQGADTVHDSIQSAEDDAVLPLEILGF